MPNVEKISVALTPEMAELVHQAVESGEYASGSEVIREALWEWKLRRSVQKQELEDLRRLWKEGIESGSGHFHDIEEIKEEARRRFGTAHKDA